MLICARDVVLEDTRVSCDSCLGIDSTSERVYFPVLLLVTDCSGSREQLFALYVAPLNTIVAHEMTSSEVFVS